MAWCNACHHSFYGNSCYSCGPLDNAGQVGIDSSLDLDVGIGGGLAVDLTNGDLVIDGIDTGLEL